MKRLILNLLFLVPLSLYGQSNVYQPVLGKNNTEWNLLHCSNGGCVTDEMFAVDDTLVNGHHWKFMNGFHFHKKLLIREDTTTRKIYFYPLIGLYKEQELLAYDFTLEAGDSMHLYNPLSPVADSAGVFVVDSTAYHEVLSTKRKFIYLRTTDQSSDEYGNPVWVEGAGSLSIIDAPAVEADSSHFGEITCVHRDGELIYRSELASIRDTCIIETSQSNIKEEETLVSFKVSPHPLHGISNIQFTRPMHVFKMSLFDLRGKLIFSEDVNQQIQTMKFSSEELRDGVYFLRIYSENGVQVSKLIKQ